MAGGLVQLTVGVAARTVKLRSTAGAALKFVLPPWLASIVTTPAPVKVSEFPCNVAGPAITLKLTGKPDDALAAKTLGDALKVTSGSEPKVIACPALRTVNELVTLRLV